ncbi:MAG: PEP-CTERM sorting domain-containing protein [Cyanobacteria bacterium J06642_2]
MKLAKLGSVAAASAVAFGATLSSGVANAALITSDLGYNLEGSLFFSVNAFDFITEPGDGGDGSPSPGVAGTYSTGFSDFGPTGTSGMIADLCIDDVFPCTTVPTAEAPVASFLTFDDGSFDLGTISGPLVDVGPAFTTVTFDVTGTFIDALDLSETPGMGRFTSQIPNSDFTGPDLIAFLAAQGPDFFIGPRTYSAAFVAVPEPATTVGLVAAGLMGAATRLRKKKDVDADSADA